MDSGREAGAALAASVLARTTLLAFLWWAITEGYGGSWVLGAVAVLVAVLCSYLVLPHAGWWIRPRGLVRFLPFFLRESALGGLDVGARALHPRLPLDPGTIDYPLRLPDGLPRACFVGALSLLPGTLSVRLGEDALRVHLLDRGSPAREHIEQLEQRLAGVFGVEL